MADEEIQVSANAASPQADEDVKMEDDMNEEEQEEEDDDATDSKVSRDHYAAMRNVVEIVNTHKITVCGEEHYPAHLFRRIVNKRLMPDYYEVIKDPIALSTIRSKILRKQYTEFKEYVRDFAQIVHNAKLYNRPNSGAYNDAIAFEDVVKSELAKLVESQLISQEETEFPYLGEIPEATPEPDPPEEEELEEEGDEDEDDEDDEGDDSDDEKAGRRRRNRKSLGGRRRDDDDEKKGGDESRKRRGRPPRVDTPMEARIKAVLKGIRKFKDEHGRLKVLHFQRLPDKVLNPEYYAAVQNPIAIDLIKRKAKRKKYRSLDEFMKDLDLMFENAKMYNEDDSDVYKAAADLQAQSHKLMEEEKNKSDAELAGDDGRFPLPQGILHNNEVYKVGDWVHIQNPNDVTKPIVAQIYRTWQDSEKQMWINACWYYRPEQTVHQFEKHFFPNEVVKTGQYRDHHIDEVVGRCFVMFFTRFSRGRPRGLDPETEVYVCEARYNEEKHKLNKIKTWASCLPDEVRENDYQMDMFDQPRRIKKLPSPLLHLLSDDTKEVRYPHEVPSPKWGAPNAPPVVGAIYKGLRDENQSPPPEPTPPPPPTPQPAPVSQISMVSQEPPRRTLDAQGDAIMENGPRRPSMASASPAPQAGQYQSQQLVARPPSSASPAPVFQRNDSFNRQQPSSIPPQTPTPTYGLATPAYNPYSQPQIQSHRPPNIPTPTTGLTASYNTNNVRSVETYVMSDTANAAIPPEIRQQFQTDEQGRILFFTAPPVDRLPYVQPETGTPLAHTAEYLAKKLQKETALLEAEADSKEQHVEDSSEGLTLKQKRFLELAHRANKRQKTEGDERRARFTSSTASHQGPKDILAQLNSPDILDAMLQHHDNWMHSFYGITKGSHNADSYEDFLEKETYLQRLRAEGFETDNSTKNQILSQCGGLTASARPLGEGEAIQRAKKRLGERDCKLTEKVKLRAMIAEYESRNYQKPVYLDDIDPRYGPM